MYAALYNDQGHKESWQRLIGAARHQAIMAAVLDRSAWRNNRERAGVLPGPKV
jgi:hypothetical protein